ncbi:FliM/FliN family flagellar motor switch protein [Herbaspirillum sp. WGmk3]|uniref:FliM/FliN family flagellar motor switch protein n=1 Tax=Herbaspirillum sp. WGmk3 TaxID=2919925 RepID=UPI0020902E6F|nr:FliM/FliN family flagellar motor switch protein [Herbaspirillum sp. WGmk3]MCO4855924.1 FliM/FliN family flagellar motor switch protein [Herbaspirillum sp. WGmk3]
MSKLTPLSPTLAVASEEQAQPTAQMLAFSELSGTGQEGRKVLDNVNPLHQIKTRLSVSVGEVELTVGELLSAREQQVVRLDRTIEQPVDLLLDGRVVARGQLVAVDEHFAVRITELPVSLKV